MIGEVVSEVISHAAATSFIHMQMLAAIQVPHNIRKTGEPSGAQADSDAAWAGARAPGAPGGVEGSMGIREPVVPKNSRRLHGHPCRSTGKRD